MSEPDEEPADIQVVEMRLPYAKLSPQERDALAVLLGPGRQVAVAVDPDTLTPEESVALRVLLAGYDIREMAAAGFVDMTRDGRVHVTGAGRAAAAGSPS